MPTPPGSWRRRSEPSWSSTSSPQQNRVKESPFFFGGPKTRNGIKPKKPSLASREERGRGRGKNRRRRGRGGRKGYRLPTAVRPGRRAARGSSSRGFDGGVGKGATFRGGGGGSRPSRRLPAQPWLTSNSDHDSGLPPPHNSGEALLLLLPSSPASLVVALPWGRGRVYI